MTTKPSSLPGLIFLHSTEHCQACRIFYLRSIVCVSPVARQPHDSWPLCCSPVVSAVPGIRSIEHHTLCQDLWTERRHECTHCFMNENLHLIYSYNNAMRQIFLTLILQMSRLRLRQATVCLLLSVHIQDLLLCAFKDF